MNPVSLWQKRGRAMERLMVQLKKSPHHKLNLAVLYARMSAAVWCCPYFSFKDHYSNVLMTTSES